LEMLGQSVSGKNDHVVCQDFFDVGYVAHVVSLPRTRKHAIGVNPYVFF